MATETGNELLEMTGDIVSAHVASNSVHAGELPALIRSVYDALRSLGEPAPEPQPEKPRGAVSGRKSLANAGHIISMIDGKPYKMLRRHISKNGYTPESYRETFGLPNDYPMVAQDYAQTRRELAHKIGLGRKPKTAAIPIAETPARRGRKPKAAASVAEPAPARRGRKPKTLGDALGAAKEHLGGE